MEYGEMVLYFRNSIITVIPSKPGENTLWFWGTKSSRPK